MNIQVSFFCKIFVADTAGKRFNALMFSDVNLQTRFLGVAHRAQWTGMWLHISVIHHMCFKVSLCYKGIIAARVLAFVWPIVSLNNILYH